MNLDFTGPDYVHSLRIGDEVHRCGTWGGIGSETTFIDPRFTGHGMRELTADPSDECAVR